MAPSAFDEYDGYASQRAAVATGGSGLSDQYEGTYAIGFIIHDGAVDPDDVRSELLAAIRPADVIVEDRRTEHDWGASGPVLFELLIGAAGSLSASIVFETICGLTRRARRSDDVPELDMPAAEQVWTNFETFVGSALRGRNARLTSVEHRGDHWYVSARCSRGDVEGLVDDRGEIVVVRVRGADDPPLTWPPSG